MSKIKLATKRMSECCSFISDGDHLSPPKTNSGIPFITISNITSDNQISFENTMFVGQNYYDNLSHTKKAKKGDILYSVVGSYGKPVYLSKDKSFIFQRHIAILRPNETINGKYLYYVMLNPYFYKRVDKLVIGCSQKTLTLDALRSIDIDIPDIVEQAKIANVLSSIDQKIQLNNKINEILQQQASLLYDYWFTQFDFPDENGKPYKSSGGKMVWNEELKREIPEFWEAKRINELVSENTRGITPIYNECKNIPVINQKCIRNNNIIFEEVYWHDSAVKYADNLKLMFMDTLVNSMGTGTLGRISPYILPYEAVPHSCVTLLRCKKDISLPCWFYYSVKKMEPSITQKGIGSTGQTSLNNNDLGELYIVVPPYNFMSDFENKVEPICRLLMKNNVENHQLTALRDWLLPMLMNGQAMVLEKQKPVLHVCENGTKNEQDCRFALWLQNQGLAARGDIDKQTLREIFDAMDDDDK